MTTPEPDAVRVVSEVLHPYDRDGEAARSILAALDAAGYSLVKGRLEPWWWQWNGKPFLYLLVTGATDAG